MKRAALKHEPSNNGKAKFFDNRLALGQCPSSTDPMEPARVGLGG
jgi:hypothetical protein